MLSHIKKQGPRKQLIQFIMSKFLGLQSALTRPDLPLAWPQQCQDWGHQKHATCPLGQAVGLVVLQRFSENTLTPLVGHGREEKVI